MHSLLKKLDLRSDSHPYSYPSKGHVDLPTKPVGHSRARSRTVQPSAACRGLYAAPKRRTKNARSNDKDDKDPIIECSIYPQMNGKRRSELEAQARHRSTKCDRVSDEARHYENTTRFDRRVRRQQTESCVRYCSVELDFKAPLKHRKASAMSPNGSSSNGSSPEARLTWSPTSRTFKHNSLPGDEHQVLVRRQKMQRAREVLMQHYTHHGAVQGGHVEHGMMQGFTVRNSERRRLSKMHYAVRKALQANLDLNDEDFKLALNRWADRVYFCELSDVDGLPVDEQMINDFIPLYQKAREAAIEANLLGGPRTEPVQRTWLNERNHRIRQATLALQRVDSAVTMEVLVERPRLVSKFSWDSDDGVGDSRQRRTKTER